MRAAPCFALALLLLAWIQPPPSGVADSLTRLSRAASQVREIAMERIDYRQRLNDYADRMQKAVKSLVESTKVAPDSFRKSLDLDAGALEKVSRQPSPAEKVLFVCGAVADDLGIKADYVVARNGSAKDVPVEAWTKREAETRNGYEVWYTPAAYRDDASEHKRFSKVSSPTTEPLPPGGYLMWSRKGPASGEQRPVDVGKKGESGKSVDLPVPDGGGRD